MLARVDAVLKPGECRAVFILAATAAALRKAEQKIVRNPGTPALLSRKQWHKGDVDYRKP
jgi:hypothetical protein